MSFSHPARTSRSCTMWQRAPNTASSNSTASSGRSCMSTSLVRVFFFVTDFFFLSCVTFRRRQAGGRRKGSAETYADLPVLFSFHTVNDLSGHVPRCTESKNQLPWTSARLLRSTPSTALGADVNPLTHALSKARASGQLPSRLRPTLLPPSRHLPPLSTPDICLSWVLSLKRLPPLPNQRSRSELPGPRVHHYRSSHSTFYIVQLGAASSFGASDWTGTKRRLKD